MSPSFAATHADPSMGFRIVPRWFRQTEFWQLLEGSHRAVLDQLYQQIASQRVTQAGTGIVCDRGQWAISYDGLAAASGTTKKTVRNAIERALHFGVIRQDVIVKRLPGRTLHISLFTWLDFDTYDICTGATGTPLGTPQGTPEGTRGGRVIHNSNTPREDTKGKTPSEDVGACGPLAGFADSPSGVASSAPVTSGGDDAGCKPGGSATSAKPNARKAKHGKTKSSSGLTDEHKLAVRSSASAMASWLCYGRNALGKVKDDFMHLPKATTHWAPASGNLNRPEHGATHAQLAAFTWWRFSKTRELLGQPIELPPMGRLIGTVKNLRTQMTENELVDLVIALTKHWGEIIRACAWMTTPPQLDERTLTDKKVIDLAKRLASGQPVQKPAPVVGVAVSDETEKLIKERYANLF